MKTSIGIFGPFDVSTIRDIVEHLDDYNDDDPIYVKDVATLGPETPAIVPPASLSVQLEAEMGFRHLAIVDEAKEAVDDFGRCNDDQRFRELLRRIEHYGS